MIISLKQREIKFKPTIKLNGNINVSLTSGMSWKKRFEAFLEVNCENIAVHIQRIVSMLH